MTSYLDQLRVCANRDVQVLLEKEQDYKGSWKKRGGCGAYMMLARKWDRLEAIMERSNWDIFTVWENDPRLEGIRDDIRDLRRYLLLVEAEMEARQMAKDQSSNVVGNSITTIPS